MNEMPNRKSIRIKEYDYSQTGCYFVTVCTYKRQKMFEMYAVGNDLCVVPSAATNITSDCLPNRIIKKWLTETENKFGVKIDYYVIMPDHIHFVLEISDNAKENCTAERHIGRSQRGIRVA